MQSMPSSYIKHTSISEGLILLSKPQGLLNYIATLKIHILISLHMHS